jgi:predicted house-cleaning NTP pyrophosphatase (Maf/HAM1 superfamily)
MLVLASQSPRRSQLISLFGWEFTVIPSKVEEEIVPEELPGEYVRRVALEKARDIFGNLNDYAGTEALIVAADTVVVDWGKSGPGREVTNDGQAVPSADISKFEILGKPADLEEARRVLYRLRGRIHQVHTAMVVIRSQDGKQFIDACITDVPMRVYSDEELEAYVASRDPLDKAGSYAIQHSGFHPVQNLQGCYANVMGLPLCHLTRTLLKAGRLISKDIPAACQAFLEYDCPVYNKILEGY